MQRVRGGGAVQALKDVLCGAAMGVAFIIPGFSGGTVAAILGVYERLVGAVCDLFKHFAVSIRTLLPVALGMLLGAAALILPIGWGLEHCPVPTVSLFVGLALGGLPPLRRRAGKYDLKKLALSAAAFALTLALAFLPSASRPAGFLYHLGLGGYVLLFFVGLAASCALVIPGISGSMLLLILGYYGPLVSLITDLVLKGSHPFESILVLGVLALGIAAGFFAVSAVMRRLLARFPQMTYACILGFILGSVPCVYLSVVSEASPQTWVAAFLCVLLGAVLSYAFVLWSERHRRP